MNFEENNFNTLIKFNPGQSEGSNMKVKLKVLRYKLIPNDFNQYRNLGQTLYSAKGF